MQYFLASASPRRSELLQQVGLPFSILSSSYSEESVLFSCPIEMVRHHALGKARGALPLPSSGICIGADTVVVLGDEVMGKPASVLQARQMIGQLSGREHSVITGIALIDQLGKSVVAHEVTKVRFRSLTTREIDAYVDSGEPMDKAGAYAIQGRAAVFITGVTGCYSNVVGLPLALLASTLQQHWGVRLAEVWR